MKTVVEGRGEKHKNANLKENLVCNISRLENSSVERESASRDSEKMTNFQTDKMHVLSVPLHVRLSWCTF